MFEYARVLVGDGVVLQVHLDALDRVVKATLLATGASIGIPDAWRQRSAQVRGDGPGGLIGPSRERWWAPDYRTSAWQPCW